MFLCSLKFLTGCSVLGFVICADLQYESRKPRILTFNADADDVEIGFDFSIPFLKIPIKKTIDAVAQYGFPGVSFPTINLNPVALMLSGLLIISASFFGPLLHKAVAWHHFDRSSRNNRVDGFFAIIWKRIASTKSRLESSSNIILKVIADPPDRQDSAFKAHWMSALVLALENETDTTWYMTEKLLSNSRGCPERLACWSFQKNKNPEVIKTLKQIMSNRLLSSMINTTALEIATAQGRIGQNCELYNPCPIDEKALPKILDSFTILTNMKTHG